MTHPELSEALDCRITITSFSDDLLASDEPCSFATHLPVEVRQGDQLVGRLHAMLLRVASAERSGVPPAELFDSVDQDMHELFCAIFDEESETLRGDLAEASDLRDVLYIESVKVIPSRRGHELGLRVVERVRDLFGGGCAVLALKAHPLSRDEVRHDDAINHEVFAVPFAARGEAAKAKLRTYWGRLGFRRVDTTDYMIFDMAEEQPES